MSDGFDGLIDTANAFFAELAVNNRKEWFEPRKAAYVAEIRKPAELLADLLAEDLGRLTGTTFKPKVFRIYRDMRFSKDKTPYNAHLHLSFLARGEGAPGWFLGASPEYLMLATGLPSLAGGPLVHLRKAIDRDGDALSQALCRAEQAVGATLSNCGPEPLKRVPRPYPADHPHGALLRRKGLVVQADLPEGWRDAGLIASLMDRAAGLLPIWRWLDGAMGPP